MIDPKVQYIIDVLKLHLGVEVSEESLMNVDVLQEFMESKDFMKVYAFTSAEENRSVIFSDKVGSSDTCGRVVAFYKNKPCVLEEKESFLNLVQIVTINGTATASLYNSLKNVYLPLLSKEGSKHANIERQVASLQEDLRVALLSSDEAKDFQDTISTVVTSLEHELLFWENQIKNQANGKEAKEALVFKDILKPLADEFCVLDALQLDEIDNILENAHNVLDDLWRQSNPYPKERMKHLLSIIGEDLERSIKKRLWSLDFWNDGFNAVSDELNQCVGISEHWMLTCKQLTEIFWPNYSVNPWTDAPHEPQKLKNLRNRLQEILKIRTTHKQLVRLLTINEQEDLDVITMFKPFKELDALDCGSHKTRQWAVAKQQFEYLLRPAEQMVASKLKRQFNGLTNIRQLLHEYGRYAELISRPIMKSILLNERQYLLSALKEYLDRLESNPNEEVYTKDDDVSDIIIEIKAIREMEFKVIEMEKTSEKILEDLDGYNDFKFRISEFLKQIKQQHNDLFTTWSSEVTAKIRDKTLSLQESDPVVKFSSDQLMTVNYSPRLVTLNNEVRQLAAMGYKIPSNIEETSKHAKQFLKYARVLEQIANFHNTIGDRMIPSQRPMMLTSAVNLSKLVQDQEVVSWGRLDAVEKYVESLKAAVERLSKDNNYLTSCHNEIQDKVNKLEAMDLIKDFEKWKESTKSMREIVDQVEAKGFKSVQSWKTAIDKSISVVLEKHYVRSLDSLHLYLPEIFTDLVYRNGQLQFSPDETILRDKFQIQVKRFLDIPKHFRGVSEVGEKSVFALIIEKNEKELNRINLHMEDLFEQLQSTKNHWKAWIPQMETDNSNLKRWQDWDLHFRASKTFGQEIAKLPSKEEKVGCFVIGLSRLRIDLEGHNRSQWDMLTSSLKDSIAEDVVKLQQYIDPSTATLTKQPVTLEQIGEADATYANILKQSEEMETLYKEMHHKVTILSSWTRERVDSVGRLTGAWERLQNLLENHQHIIAKQVETVKATLKINKDNLEEEIDRFGAKWEQIKPKTGSGHIVNESMDQLLQHLKNVKEKRQQWNDLIDQFEKLIQDYDKFGLEKPTLALQDSIKNDLEREETIWSLFEEFYNEFEKLASEEWIVFRKRCYKFEDFLSNWRERLEKMENSPLVTRILQEIHKYEDVLPVLKYVRGEEYTDKHWMEVYSLVGITQKSVDTLTLKDLLEVSDKLIENLDKLKALNKRAASEVVVRQALSELDQWEVEARFALTTHMDSSEKPISVVKNYKEILGKIGDNQSLLQSVKNSADYETFSERAEIWETRLADLDKYLTSIVQIQRKWMYLEPIFSGGTLEQEKSRFARLDKEFRHLFSFIEKDVRVTALLRYPSLRSVLENLQNQLSRCQQSLDEFLTEKRNKFPRFLFLGDDDLLEVVGQSSKEKIIQTHLKKLFAGIDSIVLDGTGKNIVAICSLQREMVPLKSHVAINVPVEDWLNNLVSAMQSSLKDLLVLCFSEGNKADPSKYPSQILCLSESIHFTSKCEHAIDTMTLPPLLAQYKAQLSHLSSFELSDDPERSLTSFGSTNSDDENNLLEIKLKALLLDTIHFINILESLMSANVTSKSDWSWQKQLRFYADNKGNVTVKMAHAIMEYSYEYLGNGQKLVRTPLTDRCFLTLTQGMFLGMGGNPYGPAGTGKTESVKALGALLGRQVLVFNCDEGIDAVSMGRILSGLVKSGAWGCFDEFNRLDEATLSAISMYIQSIQTALKTQQKSVTLLGQEMTLNNHCGIFVTLNPAGGSYGGRNKLPDNLKQLFRPVVMTHPDHLEIARTLLHCDGYKNADVIARKLVEVLDLSSKLLSKKQHYDWGLRAIRTVLVSCGRSLRNHKKASQEFKETETIQTELALIVRSLRSDTLSKLSFTDSIKFDGLLQDVFFGVKLDITENAALSERLKSTCVELGLQVNERQINKCLQLYEQMKQRMGVVLVGPPGSGKTTVRNILFHALVSHGKLLKQHILNPKAMSRSHLLGQIDTNTRQWTDGVLTLYSLQVTTEPSEVWSWIVCDGDIDPEWIESLNSVLDDNRILCLPSGWRIQFGPNVNFLFETHSLEYASPATVSRLGIVFLSEEDVDLNDCVVNFLNGQSEDVKVVLEPLVNEYLFRGIDWVVKNGEAKSKLAVLNTVLVFLDGVKSKTEFAVALIHGLGCQLGDDFKEAFAQEVLAWTGEVSPSNASLVCYNKERDLVDTYVVVNETNDFSTNSLPLIHTAHIQQTLDCLKTFLDSRFESNILLLGEHGSAKRLIVEQLVKDCHDMDLAIIYCSAHETPSTIIHKFKEHCFAVSTNKGRVYKPKKSRLLLYLKNIHLLKQDDWGTNMLLAFLQQIIAYRGFFDSSLEWVGIENVLIVGSLSGINNLPIRFVSNLHSYYVSVPSQENLSVILYSHLVAIFKNFGSTKEIRMKETISKICNLMLSIYMEVRSSFSNIDQHHYTFSPQDLTDWCQGLLYYQIEINSEKCLMEIICYEALKIFSDKLVNKSDREKFLTILKNQLQKHCGTTSFLSSIEKQYFVPFQTKTKQSKQLTKLSQEDWINIVKKGINQYEREGQYLKLTIIEELIHLTASTVKALISKGHLLMVGKSGVGRRSSVKIISALMSAKLVIPFSSRTNKFNMELKNAIQSVVLGEEVYLILQDHVLVNEDILSVTNTLISCGEVYGLYSSAEIETLLAGLKDEAGQENFEGDMMQFFVERIKKKLHVIIVLDVDNEKLIQIFETCPAVLQNCAIIWQTNWSKHTLESIPNIILTERLSNQKLVVPPELYKIYEVVQQKLEAPSRYISLLNLYIKLFTNKLQVTESKRKKLQAGISKLTEARNVVAKLRKSASIQQEKLEEKRAKATTALEMISNTMKNANVQKEEMQVLKQQTEKENEQLMKRKSEIEDELKEVEPLIREARAAVGNIRPESLSEIRSLRAPPEIIRDILEGVLRLMGIQDTSWNSMKTFLAKRGVKEDIRSFDASRISPESRQIVEKLISTKKDSFDQKSAKRASAVAAPLVAWVLANVKYSKISENIRPLEREQNRLKQNLRNAELQLSELSSGLLDVDATVARLKDELSTYTKEAAEIEIRLEKAQDTLASAEGLVQKLNEEFERWKIQLEELGYEQDNLPANCLLAAAFIAYLPDDSEDKRMSTLNKWIDIFKADKSDYDQFVLQNFLSTEREQLQWQTEGLSSDQLSTQNAIVIIQTNLTPLILDPTSTALNWLKKHLKHKNVESLTQDSEKFEVKLDLAVRFGKTLIVEDVESISPILFPILKHEFVIQGERKLININGKLVDFHNDFQLILSSRNANLVISSELSAIVNVVDFTITRAGLTEQLLTSAIRQENPELEIRRNNLLKEREEMQEKLHEFQDKLLEDLASSTGNLLEDTNLLNSLNETKASSVRISSALKESSEVQKKITEESATFEKISSFGSFLFFAANEISKLNKMYLISVKAFTRLFLRTIASFQETEVSFDAQQRLFLQSLYKFMSRGIFKADRLIFAMHLIRKVFPEQISQQEWNLFVGNVFAASKQDTSENDIPKWIPQLSKQLILNLQNILPEFYEQLRLQDFTSWKKILEDDIEDLKYPSHLKLSAFQKLLVAQILRPDKLHSAMQKTVFNLTGLTSIHPEMTPLSQILKESINAEPILFLIASGNDPSLEVKQLAENSGKKYFEIAMGESQDKQAITILNEAADSGAWLILKNLHLVVSWLPFLCQNLQKIALHNDFRLWLITEQHQGFSSVLIQQSLKIAYEAPQGLKYNLQHTYAIWGDSYVNRLSPVASRIFFVCSCFHAILQERRTYIPQGWLSWYEFSDIDLTTAVKLGEMLWDTQKIEWKYFIGLLHDAVYGGRIEDLQDLKILNSYLKIYFSEEILSHRWKPFDVQTALPTTSNHSEYTKWISSLPNSNVASYFGLPENINNSWEKIVSSTIISRLKDLELTRNVSDGFDLKQWQKSLTPFIGLWKKLNQGQDFVKTNIPEATKVGSPLVIFVSEEYRGAIRLIHSIHKSFSILNKIVRGSILPDRNFMEFAHDLLAHQSPKIWMRFWKGPKDPSKYLQELLTKTVNLEKWKDCSFINGRVNLMHCFHPETFLASYKQEYSRKNNIPIDELRLSVSWKLGNPSNGIVLTGLLVEGALFDGNTLLPCKANSESISSAPDCFVTWNIKQNDLLQNDQSLDVPLYFTSSREKHLTDFQVHCNIGENDKWILAGLAFFLNY